MTQFRVKPGSKVTIGIRGDAEAEQSETQGRFIGVESDDQSYVFRKRTELAFYDLGSRLRSVPPSTDFTEYRLREYLAQDATLPNNEDGYFNEYVEVRFEAQGNHTEGDNPSVELSDAEWRQLDKILLGSRAVLDPEEEPPDPVDPFGTSAANGSQRSLSNSLRIPAEMISQVLPAFYLVADDEFEPYPFNFDGDPNITTGFRAPFPEEQLPADLLGTAFKPREAKPADADERWNPYNIDSGAAQRELEIDAAHYKSDKGKHLLIANLDNFTGIPGLPPSEVVRVPRYVGAAGGGTLGWHGFFTRDTANFHLTRTPSYQADAVTYHFKDRDAVFLRPAVVPVRLGVFDPLFETHSAWVARWASVYPNISFLDAGNAEADHIVAVRSFFSNNLTAPEGAVIKVVGSEYWLPAGALVGVIKQGSTLFYVWTKTNVRRVANIFS